MDIPAEYFLNSTDELDFEAELFRTEGSWQIQRWANFGTDVDLEGAIKYRRYFKGVYKGKTFFAKQFLTPNAKGWSIDQSIRYQFENILILSDLPFVPAPLFYNSTMLGIEFVEGRSIRQLAVEGKFNRELGDEIIPNLSSYLHQIEDRLTLRGRRYDASLNNVLIGEGNSIHFIDFDYVDPGSGKHKLVDYVRRLATGETYFDDRGKLIASDRNPLRSGARKLIRAFLRRNRQSHS